MLRCWGRNIRAHSSKAKRAGGGLIPLLVCALTAGAQTDPALRLKAGVEALDKNASAVALGQFSGLPARLPQIADYLAFWTAQAHLQSRNYAAVAPALEPVFRQTPASPLAGRAAIMAARALVELNSFGPALQALSRVAMDQLPMPQAALLFAQAYSGTGDSVSAAVQYQTVYFYYPLTAEAGDAGTALAGLERELGERYPPAMPTARLQRSQKLIDGGQATRAKSELEAMIPLLGGLERDQARVRLGAADYQMKRTETAASYLRSLQVDDPEAEAERLYYLAACYRRLDRDAEMLATVQEIGPKAPSSPWRLKALILAANNYLVANDWRKFTPLFQACAEAFPNSEEGPGCHWKYTWRVYLERKANAGELLRQHVTQYPSSDKAGAALYYLGRLAESASDLPAAKRFYNEVLGRFPNYYYTALAREQLKRSQVALAAASPETERWLGTIAWPDRIRQADFNADELTSRRIERARLLARAGLDQWAEGELRFGIRNGGKRFPLAVELAETAHRRGAPDVGLRYIKSTIPDYLWLTAEGAPKSFWKLAFPFPYRAKIERFAKERSLDPFLVAALIRQESEFNPAAISVAKAVGLMQVMPGTGRELGRRVGLKAVMPSSLKVPDINLNIGTYYLQHQLAARNGSVEDTLAGYNAGPSRVPVWRSWWDFRESSEFVETIPFTQTREYVQIVMRNAEMYRRIYANEPYSIEPEPPPPPATITAAPPARKTAKAPVKATTRKSKHSNSKKGKPSATRTNN
ncbi:lytic transglycosylase domain-containing protein [Paludibaculum fermentans]|uniref:lytic transglycosylase domain-containing protein n=1 Tax=Paludibaculum fermentans TaxID=1473598 RepID=UPI001E320CFD|nr:transglycosylase SLT domain-containing protein [Paludibaculum fermentans]